MTARIPRQFLLELGREIAKEIPQRKLASALQDWREKQKSLAMASNQNRIAALNRGFPRLATSKRRRGGRPRKQR